MKMLELRVYERHEMVELLGTNDRQRIRRKLDGYGVFYLVEGRGDHFTINVKLIDVLQQFVRQAKNGVLLVYENAQREDADASVICPKNAPPYILQNNVRALGGVPMKGTWS